MAIFVPISRKNAELGNYISIIMRFPGYKEIVIRSFVDSGAQLSILYPNFIPV